jgi:hypothetical protein
VNQALMRLLIHTVNTSIFSGPEILIPPSSSSPPRLVVLAQSLLYFSLSCTLLAALLAVLGKQWLMYYSAAGERGTIEARGLERQRKFDGLHRWKFNAVMQMFPLLLQLSLLLFAAALSLYLWTVHRSLAIIVLVLTSLGVGMYLLLLVSAVLYPDSPFQNPLATVAFRILHSTISVMLQEYFIRTSSAPRNFIRQWLTTPLWHAIERISSIYSNYASSHDILSHFFIKRSPLDMETEPKRLLDSLYLTDTPSPEVPAVAWVLKTSTDPHVIQSAAQMVVDLHWPSTGDFHQQKTKLLHTFMECWSFSTWELVNTHHVVDLGRAYCSLYCANWEEKPFLLQVLPSSHSDPDVNNILCILQGLPHLIFDSGDPRALGWALHVIPSFCRYTSSEDRLMALEYFLTAFDKMPLDLDSSYFSEYLFCVNNFLGPVSRHDLVCMNKR